MLEAVFEVQNGHFVQVFDCGNKINSTPGEYKESWMCHMCNSFPSKYKVITSKKFSLICPSCSTFFDKMAMDIFVGEGAYEYFHKK